jgi:hypothetical protein
MWHTSILVTSFLTKDVPECFTDVWYIGKVQCIHQDIKKSMTRNVSSDSIFPNKSHPFSIVWEDDTYTKSLNLLVSVKKSMCKRPMTCCIRMRRWATSVCGLKLPVYVKKSCERGLWYASNSVPSPQTAMYVSSDWLSCSAWRQTVRWGGADVWRLTSASRQAWRQPIFFWKKNFSIFF